MLEIYFSDRCLFTISSTIVNKYPANDVTNAMHIVSSQPNPNNMAYNNPFQNPIHTIQLNNIPVKEYFDMKSRIFSNNHERVIIIVLPSAAKIVSAIIMSYFFPNVFL